MDIVAPNSHPDSLSDFDSTGIAAAVDALAKQHSGREDMFRAAVVQFLKTELVKARAAAQAQLLKDRHGRLCAEQLCFVQDEIIRILYAAATQHLYRSEVPSGAERMAVVATGGYGRGLMAPESDIDLLFILPYKQTAWGEQVAEAILYSLWDMGLKVGHATRSVDESIRQARGDMTIRTAILETRYLAGDKPLYDELVQRFDSEVVQGTAAEFVAAKLAEREERHRRGGQSRYLVEPNVKDGKGGLRDLHTLFWIAKYVYRVRETAELVERGVFDAHEYRTFRRCADFLWSVRCNLHFVSGRPEERLSFDLQREIAVRLGYTSHPGLQDVERFMKHYFLVAKQVGNLTAILCAKLEDQQAKAAPVLSRMISRLTTGSTWRRVPESDDFIVDNNRINLAAPDVFKHDPVNLIRIFRLAQKNNLAFHPDAMRAVTRSLNMINTGLRDDPEANRLFVEILTSNDAETVLRRMNETGVLGHFISAFGRIVSMMQFNMYHHYTVDEHLIRCIGFLQEIERGGNDEFTLASDLMRKIRPEHRAVIYITVLLHDVAKGRPEDHSIAGAKIARRLCPRLGFSNADTELIAWLIEEHLTMSTVAQSRDLSDRKTIENFAAVVQSVEQMKLLTILTTADIRGVGPGVWNGWKAQLLRTLYYETEPVLTGGFSEVNRAKRITAAQAEFRHAFTDWPEDELTTYLRSGQSRFHGVAAGPMAPIVEDLATLPDADIRAMATYLASFQEHTPEPEKLEAMAFELEARTKVTSASSPAARLYLGACAVCHEVGGLPLFGSRPSLALNSNLHGATPDNLIQVILHGIMKPASSDLGYMPAFKDHLSDAQLAEFVSYLRGQFAPDKPAWADVDAAISRVRPAEPH